MIALDKANMAQDQSREWLETNGLGGYASSTVLGANTRRYHGLLVAALHPPADRYVLLSKLEETLETGAGRFELSTNQYPGAIHPHGYQYFRRFRLDLYPNFFYEAGEVTLEKTIFMPHGENTVVVQYRVLDWGALAPEQRQCRLELRPLLAFRGFHELTRANAPASRRTRARSLCNPTTRFPGFISRMTPMPCWPAAIGITTSSMPWSASAASTFRKICSIRFS